MREHVYLGHDRDLITAELVHVLASSCPRLTRLAFSGFSLSITALEFLNSGGNSAPWRDSLCSFELFTRGIPKLDFQYDLLLTGFFKSHPLLKHVEVCVENFSTLHNEFIAASSPTSRHVFAPAADMNNEENSSVNEIRVRDALNQRLGKIYEDELRKRVWWLESVKVFTPSLRNHRLRSVLLRRIGARQP
ncbi:hypothetical protein BC829DRAFT_250471 [Chytridium lagenaria]|nr:hypothetical protein BC829DRAFT_250471 [Chytridium lagenaria]